MYLWQQEVTYGLVFLFDSPEKSSDVVCLLGVRRLKCFPCPIPTTIWDIDFCSQRIMVNAHWVPANALNSLYELIPSVLTIVLQGGCYFGPFYRGRNWGTERLSNLLKDSASSMQQNWVWNPTDSLDSSLRTFYDIATETEGDRQDDLAQELSPPGVASPPHGRTLPGLVLCWFRAKGPLAPRCEGLANVVKARASSVPQLPCPWAEPTLSWADLPGLDLGLTPPDLHSESLGLVFVESQARPWHQLPPLASNLALAKRRYPPCKDKPGATPRKMSWLSLQTEHSGTATLPKGCRNINGPLLQGMEGWGGGRHTHTLTHTHTAYFYVRGLPLMTRRSFISKHSWRYSQIGRASCRERV